jgi:hypothetical protein
MKQRVSAVVRRSSAASAAGSFGNKDLHTDTAVVHAPAWVRGDPAVCGGGPMEASGVECRHVRLALRGSPAASLTRGCPTTPCQNKP